MSPPSAALARRSSLQTAPRALRIVRRSPRAKEDQSDGPAAADIRLPPDRHLSNYQLSTISYSPASRRSLPRFADILPHRGQCGRELQSLGLSEAQFLFRSLLRNQGNDKDT
jgi:hypothetical protein